jgi:fibronectin-binding autotransporter adhesin
MKKNKPITSISVRKFFLTALVAAPLAILPSPLWALPAALTTGPAGMVVSNTTGVSITLTTPGTATTPGKLDITALADKGVIKWNNFGDATLSIQNTVGGPDTVTFNLPTSTSSILNMVIGSTSTTIDGTIKSNGNVYIMNPSGIVTTSNATFNVAGLGLSTVNEAEFNFQTYGNLSYVGNPGTTGAGAAAGNVSVMGSTVTNFAGVGTTGNVYLAGNSVDVSGSINASSLNITAKNFTNPNTLVVTTGNVRLGVTAPLTVGVPATTPDFLGNFTPGSGTLTVNTAGGSIDVANANTVTVNGASASLTTNGGAVNQTTTVNQAFVVGDTQTDNSTLTINTAGSAAPGAITLNNVNGNGKSLRTTVTGGATTITGTGDIQLNASSISGNLTVTSRDDTLSGISISNAGKNYTGLGTLAVTITPATGGQLPGGIAATAVPVLLADGSIGINITNPGSGYIAVPTVALTGAAVGGSSFAIDATKTTISGGGSIKNGGDVTVTGGTISLQANGRDKGITFKGPGDLTFTNLSANATTKNSIVVTSTNGSVILGNTTSSGQITVTAANNISQTASTAIINNAFSTVAMDKGGNLATFDAQTGSLTLDQGGTGNNQLTGIAIKDAPGGATIINKDSTQDMQIAPATTTGAVSITNVGKAVQLGRTMNTATDSANDKVVFNSNLTISTGTTAGTISDTTDKAYVFGALTLTTGGDITLDGALENTKNLPGLASQYGQVNITSTGNVKVFEQTTLNLGTITMSDSSKTFKALSTSGNIVNTGQLKINGNITVGAGTGTAPGNVNLDYTSTATGGNRLNGSISLYDDYAAQNLTGITNNYLVKNLTIANEFTTNLAGIKNTFGVGMSGDLTVTSGVAGSTSTDTITSIPVTSGGLSYLAVPTVNISAPNVAGGRQATATAVLTNGVLTGITMNNVGSGYTSAPTVSLSNPTGFFGTAAALGTPVLNAPSINATSAMIVTGKVNLTATDAVKINSSSNAFSTLNVTAGGNIDAQSSKALTVNATLTQIAAGKTASWNANNDALTIGTYTSNFSGLTTFSSGNKKNITDSVAGISIFGDVKFVADGSLSVTKTGHNFGGITIDSSPNNNSATLIESGTMRLVDVQTGKGSLNVTSTNGDIIQDTSAAQKGIRMSDNNGANTATFTAVNGKVTLSDTGNLNAWADVVINATSGSDTLIKASKSDITLGNVTTGGKLTVDMSAAGTVTGIANPVLGTGGSGYFTAPAVTLTGGGGTGATAVAKLTSSSGAISGYTITNSGTGYTSAPTAAIATAPVAPTAATLGAPVLTGTALTSVPVTAGGTFYRTAPTVTLVGGVSTVAAQAVAIIDPTTGAVTGISITNAGNYTVVPTSATLSANPIAAAPSTIVAPAVTVTGIGSGIKQATGTKVNAYDTVTLKTNNGAITTTNTGNKFGGLVLSAGSGNIAVTELTTLNLKSVQTTGNFSATSEGADIISGTDATVTPNSINVGGTTALTANNGSITANLSGSDFVGAVTMISKGDVTVLDTVGNFTFGAGSTVGGALTVRETSGGLITQLIGAPITVFGATTFDTLSTGSVAMLESGNQFGPVRFTVGAGGAKIAESTSLNLNSGSFAASGGVVQLSTTGDFVTSGAGGSSFTGDLVISAGGKITPSAGSLTVLGSLTVISSGTKDLSALSKSGNLLGKDPINIGTGAYTPPSP